MYIGTQTLPRDESDYKVWAQLGVRHITGSPPGPWSEWTVDDLASFRDRDNSMRVVSALS